MKKIKIFLSIILVCLFVNTLAYTTSADNPFKTRTVNRFGEIVESPDAYEAVLKVKTIKTFDGTFNMSSPSDIFIDKNDYLYICDTGNKQIVILDNNNNFITKFGSENLIKPTGVYVRDNIIYVADYGSPTDATSGCIWLYEINEETNEVLLKEKKSSPKSNVLEIDNFVYRPEKIAVDRNLTMYVVNEGSYSGIMTINKDNRFMSYFAPNSVEVSLKTRITNFLYGDNAKVNLTDILPTPPFNVHIDDSGYIYTVTQTVIKNDLGDTLKKVNIGGNNFYPSKMVASSDFTSCWNGTVGNVFASTKSGFIYEYDINGNILFMFGGTTSSIDQLGLFKSISGLVVNSKNQLIVLDQNDGSYQIFRPTEYTNKVHEALGLYNEGYYKESKQLWEEVLKYNSMLDIAHKGIGLTYYLQGNYKDALHEFKIANAKKEYSEAFWEIRNVWFSNHLGLLVGLILGFIALAITFIIIKKKTKLVMVLNEKLAKFKKKKPVHDFLLMFNMIKHPLDTTYFLKTDKSIKAYNGLIYLLLIFIIYIFGLTCTNFIFSNVVLERTVLLKEAFKIIIPIVLFVIANYLASSLLEGEGRLSSIFLVTLACFAPIIFIYPILVIISNALTLNESVIFNFGTFGMIFWTVILILVTNKELHNYSFKQMILNLILTAVLMLVLLIVVILCYLMFQQVADFIKDIISEAIFS